MKNGSARVSTDDPNYALNTGWFAGKCLISRPKRT